MREVRRAVCKRLQLVSSNIISRLPGTTRNKAIRCNRCYSYFYERWVSDSTPWQDVNDRRERPVDLVPQKKVLRITECPICLRVVSEMTSNFDGKSRCYRCHVSIQRHFVKTGETREWSGDLSQYNKPIPEGSVCCNCGIQRGRRNMEAFYRDKLGRVRCGNCHGHHRTWLKGEKGTPEREHAGKGKSQKKLYGVQVVIEEYEDIAEREVIRKWESHCAAQVEGNEQAEDNVEYI